MKCPRCLGTGQAKPSDGSQLVHVCSRCGGAGEVRSETVFSAPVISAKCPHGKTIGHDCGLCDLGTGRSGHVVDGAIKVEGAGPGYIMVTVRDCLDCGCLVPGGPTRCKRCAHAQEGECWDEKCPFCMGPVHNSCTEVGPPTKAFENVHVRLGKGALSGLRHNIKEREKDGKPCSVSPKVLAVLVDAAERAAIQWSYCPCCGIEAPRPGRHHAECPVSEMGP